MEEGNDQPRSGDRIYTLRNEEAFLQTGDEKPAIIAEPPPDLGPVQMLVLQEVPPASADALRR